MDDLSCALNRSNICGRIGGKIVNHLSYGSFHVRSPKKMKFERAPPQILTKLYTLPLCDYNRRSVIFLAF